MGRFIFAGDLKRGNSNKTVIKFMRNILPGEWLECGVCCLLELFCQIASIHSAK